MGLRNPYTFAFGIDSQANPRMFINDVGENTWEEDRTEASPRPNYGWPNTDEGHRQRVQLHESSVCVRSRHQRCQRPPRSPAGPSTIPPRSSSLRPTSASYFFSDLLRQLDSPFSILSRETETDFGTSCPTGRSTSRSTLPAASTISPARARAAARSFGSTTRPAPPPAHRQSALDRPAADQSYDRQSGPVRRRSALSPRDLAAWSTSGSGTVRTSSERCCPTYDLPTAQASDNGARFSVLVSNAFWATTAAVPATLIVRRPATARSHDHVSRARLDVRRWASRSASAEARPIRSGWRARRLGAHLAG